MSGVVAHNKTFQATRESIDVEKAAAAAAAASMMSFSRAFRARLFGQLRGGSGVERSTRIIYPVLAPGNAL